MDRTQAQSWGGEMCSGFRPSWSGMVMISPLGVTAPLALHYTGSACLQVMTQRRPLPLRQVGNREGIFWVSPEKAGWEPSDGFLVFDAT